jgi:hypothetical protein
MGLKPKPRKIYQAEEAIIVAHAATYAEGAVLPNNPHTLQGIVEALLLRIEGRSIAEAKMLSYYIQALAGNEVRISDQAERTKCAGLLNVAYAPTPKSDHLPQILKVQWSILTEYFEQQGFSGRVKWVSKHLSTIREQIKIWRCLCPYKLAFPGAIGKLTSIERQASLLRDAPLSSSVVMLELLAALHNHAGTSQIRRLVNSARPSLPTVEIFDPERRSVGVIDEHRFADKKAAEYLAIARHEAIKYVSSKLPGK